MVRAYLPRNTGWYRKHFKLPSSWSGKSVWLYIEGSFHATTAFLNGADIGFHEAGYTSFWLRLDNTTVHYGDTENVLALYVDASFGTGWWYEGEDVGLAGVFRCFARHTRKHDHSHNLSHVLLSCGGLLNALPLLRLCRWWSDSSSVPRCDRHNPP